MNINSKWSQRKFMSFTNKIEKENISINPSLKIYNLCNKWNNINKIDCAPAFLTEKYTLYL